MSRATGRARGSSARPGAAGAAGKGPGTSKGKHKGQGNDKGVEAQNAIDVALQARVDAQLMEQGAFTALEYLIESGRLIYADYESWRRREIDCLDDVLMGSREKILAEITHAAAYARGIGLVEQAQEFHAWQTAAVTPAPVIVAEAPFGAARLERSDDSAQLGTNMSAPVGGNAPAQLGANAPAPVGANAPAQLGATSSMTSAAAPRSSASSAPALLRASMDAKVHRLLAARFVPAQSAPQMDLFFDNPVVALTNGLVRSLASRNLPDAQQQLDRLYAQAPNHADLVSFDRLLAALSHLDRPIADVQRELDFLLDVTPIAKRILGSDARDMLSPLWRQLATALGRRPFSADNPELHRSFALTQAQDWAAVSASIQAESDWAQHPALCLRFAQSSFYRRRRNDALTAWFHLCWRAPSQASEALDSHRQADSEIASLWLKFLDFEESLDSAGSPPGIDSRTSVDFDPGIALQLSASDFPAWLLLREPDLAQSLPLDLPPNDTPGESHYRCVHRWLDARRAGRTDDEIARRRELQASQPALLVYLKRTAAGGK